MPGRHAVEAEARRLEKAGLKLLCSAQDIRAAAALTLEINRLKKLRNAVLAVHVYQRPELLAGVADFTGDSYQLAKDCQSAKADTIVFCGVRFMAETAKILNPEKRVLLPAPDAGCSLSDSITAAQVRALKKKHPGAPVVAYINTTAEVKAESDCIVTSANAAKILRVLFKKHKKIIFLPDRLMAANLAAELGVKLGKDLIPWSGACEVHERFSPAVAAHYRKAYPGAKILTHPEARPEFIAQADYSGGTSAMLDYVRTHKAPAYLLVTECGLGELARMRFPGKNFVPLCRICSHMKLTALENVLQALKKPQAGQTVEVDAKTAVKAAAAVRKMFEIAESGE